MYLSRIATAAAVALTILSLAGCGGALRSVLPATSPHERYAEGLERAGLGASALAREWRRAAERAVADPIEVDLPYRESAYAPPDGATAAGYHVRARLGQRLVVRVESESLEVFVDVFALGDGAPRRLASGRAGVALDHEPRADGDFLVRVQPELLRSGRFLVTLEAQPTLVFPVAGNASVGGGFGDPRDGGRRDHHGIDVFARRGTPVIAATDGVVGGAEENALGGIVVWLRDRARGQSLYYAHLDERRVAGGQTVRAGDTLGTVGTSGNARGSSPHLHFGVYRHGPVDPLPFVRRALEPPAITASGALLGRWVRVRDRTVTARGLEPARLMRDAVVRVDGAAGAAYRVSLPDGESALVRASALEPVDPALDQVRLAARTIALDRPEPGAVVVDTLDAGTRVGVHGRHAEFELVRLEAGRMAWIRG
jgi:peptidoglycan LD-endopeptidase LytH